MGLFGPPNIKKMKDKRDAIGLIRALTYKKNSIDFDHVTLRQAAASALGELKDARAIEPLIDELSDDSVRSEVLDALVKIGAPAVKPLISALNANMGQVGPEAALTRQYAAEALGEIGDALAVQPLIDALQDIAASWAAPEALFKIGTPAVGPLIAALKNKPAYTLCGVCRTLGKIGDARAVEPIRALLMDEDTLVRDAADKALVQIGEVQGPRKRKI